MGPQKLSPDAQLLAETIAIKYLKQTRLSRDLVIRFDENGFSNDELKKLLQSQPTRKFSYNRLTKKLKLYTMAPSPLHNTVSNFLSRFLISCIRTGFFDDWEADRISTSSNPVTIRSTYNTPIQEKPLAFAKYADASIAFGLPGAAQTQTVIFEVGLSEDEADLTADAHQWLLCTGGKTRLVVAVNIKENRRELRERRRLLSTIRRRNALVYEYGNDKAKEENILPKDGLDEGDEDEEDGLSEVSEDEKDIYDSVASRLIIDDWVGPVNATIELWDLDRNGAPRRREEPISIEPPCIPPRNPTIKITDIVIPTDRTDTARATTFDLALYRDLLAGARVEVAVSRAFKFVRPRMDDDD